MSERVLLYDGLPLVGKTTSLESIAEQVTGSSSWSWREPYLRIGYRGHKLRLFRSRLRASRYYPDPTELLANPIFQVEADVLRRVEGVVFVLDSQVERSENQHILLDQLRTDLDFLGRDADSIPLVFQVNKRDLESALPMAFFTSEYSWPECEYVESIANEGQGVVETLTRLVTRLPAQ